MKRLLSVFLLAAILTMTVACSGDGGASTTTAPVVTAAPAGDAVTTEAETTVPNVDGYPIPQIPAADYSGKTFNILGLGKANFYPYQEFVYDEEAGDVINDAIFKRNGVIKDKYGIEITQTDTQEHSPGLKMLQNAVLADSDEYQAAAISLYLMMTAAQNGHLVNLAEIPHIDTDAPWFYQDIQDSLSIGGEEYLMTSYMNMRIYDSSVLMYYNKNVVEKLQLGDLDQLALDGKWTFDMLNEYSAKYGRDVDNNGTIDANDEVGLIAHNGYILSFFVGMGGNFVEKDAEDIPTYIGINNKNETILSRVLTFLFKEPDSLHGESGKMPSYTSQFIEDRALFTAGNVFYQRSLSDNGGNYGVLPYPKFDLDQERYYVHTHSSSASALGVPMTNRDLDMTGAILADMIYLSYDYVYPAHVEKTMQYRYASDENATKLLRMTFDSLVLELSTALNLRCDTTLRQLGARKMTSFSSVFESIKSVNNDAVKKYVETFTGQ